MAKAQIILTVTKNGGRRLKKVAIVLVVIMVIGILVGGAYALSDGFKKVPWEKDPTIESNILTESKELLNNHASITFGTGDTAWTISTEDKLEPIYIDDLRAPGKGVEIGHQNSGGSSINIPLESFVKIDGVNLVQVQIATSEYDNYSISKLNGVWLWNWCSNEIYENFIFANESRIVYHEEKIQSEGYKSGDDYLLGYFNFLFIFQDIDKYGDTVSNVYSESFMSNAIMVNYTVPVYYRVK